MAQTNAAQRSGRLTVILNGSDVDRREPGINDNFPDPVYIHVIRARNNAYFFVFQTYIDLFNVGEFLQLSLEAIYTECTG